MEQKTAGVRFLGMNLSKSIDMNNPQDLQELKNELVDLFEHIQKIRREIASIRTPASDNDRFMEMTDELDAIVVATERATDSIMENVEEIDEIAMGLQEKVSDDAKEDVMKISEKTAEVIVACSFQDITGQRVTKVVKSLKYIEERVNSLISFWGKDALADSNVVEEEVKDEYQQYLNGPQLEGEGVSQDEVDLMLAGGEVAPKEKKKRIANFDVAESEAEPEEDADSGAAMGQDDIDSLFG